MTKTYKNRYGTVVLSFDENWRHVSTVHSIDISDEFKFSIDDAEKIALITDNYKLQMSGGRDLKKWYIIYNNTSDMVSLCKVEKLDFTSDVNPQKEIRATSRKYDAVINSHILANAIN